MIAYWYFCMLLILFDFYHRLLFLISFLHKKLNFLLIFFTEFDKFFWAFYLEKVY